MKTTAKFIICILMLAAVCLCFAACGEDSSKGDSQIQTTRITMKSQNEGVLCKLSYQPGGDMTQEEFDERSWNFTVFRDGKVTDEKTGEQKALSATELEKCRDFSDKVVNKQFKVVNEEGEDMPSYSFTAYDEKGVSHQQSVQSVAAIEGFDEICKIVNDKFSK